MDAAPGPGGTAAGRSPLVKRMLLLWDIDGTLVRAGDIGAAVFDLAIEEVLGTRPPERVQMSGKTDPQIVAEYLALLEVDAPGAADRILEGIAVELARSVEVMTAHGAACPGAEETLSCFAQAPGVTQSVLTGNIRPNAELKLATFGLGRYVDFEIGAYGSDHIDRRKLVPIALERTERLRGLRFEPHQVWVIGDSPNDLACARAADARCLLVATGRFGLEELSELQPDAVLEDLSDLARVQSVLSG